MNILAVGDSFTYGEELHDLNNAWPFLLGKSLSATQVVNLGEPAASNDKILRKTLEYIADADAKPDLVIVSWTHPGRMEFADDLGTYDIWPGYQGNLFLKDNQYWRTELCKYITAYHDPIFLLKRYLQSVIVLQSFLKQLDIRYVMLDILNNEFYKNLDFPNKQKFTNLVDKERYIDFYQSGMVEWAYGTPRGPNGHFLEQGHQIVANRIYEHIRHLGWIS